MKSIAIITIATICHIHAVEPVPPAVPEPPAKEAAPQPAAKPVVDVVFVLDSTGSMGGLTEGAKEKIWSIANSVIGQQPSPTVRIGLVSYREKQQAKRAELNRQLDELVRKRSDFVQQEKVRLAKEGKGDSFDLKVEEAIREQSKRNRK